MCGCAAQARLLPSNLVLSPDGGRRIAGGWAPMWLVRLFEPGYFGAK